MKYYSEEHEWVEVTGSEATVGISAHAAGELGDITFVELPEPGAVFAQGETMLVVESVKAASDVFAPVSGKVAAVNSELTDRPELVNESPEDEGWILKLTEVDSAELENLMTAEAYAEFLDRGE